MKYAQQTRMSRGIHGWQAETKIPLDGDTIKVGGRFVKVYTSKTDSGLVTTVSCCVKTEVGYQFALYQDYLKRVMKSNSRCTEKSVEVQHTTVMNDIDYHLNEVRKHYKREEATA